MAVENYKTTYEAAVPNPGTISAYDRSGVDATHFQVTVSIAAADSDGSTYLIMKDIPEHTVIGQLEIENDAITAGTDYDIGLYNPRTGLEASTGSKDNYADGLDMSSAHTKLVPLDGIAALTHSNTLKPVREVAGHDLTNKLGTYDLVLTANTVGSAAGSITFRGRLQPHG